MIWTYAICDRPQRPLPRRRGLAQAPLDGITDGPLLAVVSRHVHSPSEPAVDALWVHERVVDCLMTDHAVLPMRFASILQDDDQLRDMLHERRAAFLVALDRVRGRIELGVRALQTRGAPPAMEVEAVEEPPATGREYVLSKLRNGRRADECARLLHEPLAALAVEERRQALRSAQEVLRASYLVDRGDIARFRGAVERLQAEHPDVAILCTGPWPTYSFVDATAPSSPHVQPLRKGG